MTVMCLLPLASPGVMGDNAKSPDGISVAPQIGSKHAASHLHHPSSQMKYKGENGQWVMEIDSKET